MSLSGRRAVKITAVETLRCGAGFRDFCFVKMTTDGDMPADPENPGGGEGDRKKIVGWSEYLEGRELCIGYKATV